MPASADSTLATMGARPYKDRGVARRPRPPLPHPRLAFRPDARGLGRARSRRRRVCGSRRRRGRVPGRALASRAPAELRPREPPALGADPDDRHSHHRGLVRRDGALVRGPARPSRDALRRALARRRDHPDGPGEGRSVPLRQRRRQRDEHRHRARGVRPQLRLVHGCDVPRVGPALGVRGDEVPDPDRPASVPIRITTAAGVRSVRVNQRATGDGWTYLGTFPLLRAASVRVSARTDSPGSVAADAVKAELVTGHWAGGLASESRGWRLTRRALSWTDDAGASWRQITPPGIAPGDIRGVHFTGADGWLVASTGNAAAPLALRHTGDQGRTWSEGRLRAPRDLAAAAPVD